MPRIRYFRPEYYTTSFRDGFERRAKSWIREEIDNEVNVTIAQKGAFQVTTQNLNYEFFENFDATKMRQALGTAPVLTSMLERVATRDRRAREGVDPDPSRIQTVRFFTIPSLMSLL